MSQIAIIYGGAGALGAGLVASFKAAAWQTVCIDFAENAAADKNCKLDPSQDWAAHAASAKAFLDAAGIAKVNAVVCAAGGFCMENIASDDVFAHVDKMLAMNLRTAVTTGHIASKYLAEDGLVMLTGAKAALSPTNWAIAYGATKAATHHIIKSLAAETDALPKGASIVGILPITIDTPSNRRDMPDADVSTWTPPAAIGDKVVEWAQGTSRPEAGALVEVATTESTKHAFNVVG